MTATSIPANVNLSELGIFNVKDYGAVGDGVTDDSSAFQNAINAAYEAKGGIVYAPSAKYLLNGGPMSIPGGNGPGNPAGVNCGGLAPLPSGIVYADLAGDSLIAYYGPNNPFTGTVPGNRLPNGPLLLDNVILADDGPEQTILLAGPMIYGGYVFSPTAR